MGLTGVKYNISKLKGRKRVCFILYPAEHFTFGGKYSLNVRRNAGLNQVVHPGL